jgi:hypothetical protein
LHSNRNDGMATLPGTDRQKWIFQAEGMPGGEVRRIAKRQRGGRQSLFGAVLSLLGDGPAMRLPL